MAEEEDRPWRFTPKMVWFVTDGMQLAETLNGALITFVADDFIDWLSQGAPQGARLPEFCIEYHALDGTNRKMSGEQLLLSTRHADGRFRFDDGTGFYLFDRWGKWWVPAPA